MHNQRDLSKRTGASTPGTERKKWYTHFVFEKRHIVSFARTYDMEITRSSGKVMLLNMFSAYC